jgi:hypothetical protein
MYYYSLDNIPTVTTTIVVTGIIATTAIGGGNVINDGNSSPPSPIIARGVVWSTSINPTISDNITTEPWTLGAYSSSLTGLVEGVTYYYRAYATNRVGTAYGVEMEFIAASVNRSVKVNTCDKDSFGKDYIFYDTSGNPININYDAELDLYQGRQYFPENSSDTFKELEINMFERIKGFEYAQYNTETGSTVSELLTQKFQLFNTEGVGFVGNTQSVNITHIEAVNNDASYNSKWISGDGIDLLFPYGTEVKFNRQVFSISDDETYTVVNSKQDSILIITADNNKNFIENIGGAIDDESNYINLTISGVNAFKIYNYIDEDYRNIFPDWSEPNFYNLVYDNQKLTFINSENNNGVYSIKNKALGDNYYDNFKLLTTDLDGDLNIKLTNKTSNFNVFQGSLTFSSSDSSIQLLHNEVIPSLLKPGTDFRIPLSITNDKILTVDTVALFNNQSTTYYSDGDGSTKPDQVLYENRIYECIQSYTQSATSSVPTDEETVDSLAETQSKTQNRTAIVVDDEEPIVYVGLTPENKDFWQLTNFVYVTQNVVDEVSGSIDIFLNDNQVNLGYVYDTNLTQRVNLAKCFEFFNDDLEAVGTTQYVDPLGYYVIVKSKYPTQYIDVEYFIDKLDSFSGSVTDTTNYSPTGYTFSYDPHETSEITVRLDGNKISISEDFMSAFSFGYFSNSGAGSSLDLDNLDSDTALYWKEINANFGLTASNIITFDYTTEVSIHESIIERVLELNEDVINEQNTNISIRPERRIVITDIDEFGLKVIINEQEYLVESVMLFRDNGSIDLEESIDRTIKKWIETWKIDLDKLGIFISSDNFGFNNTTALHNSIFLRGVYANIELVVDVIVGDTAAFYFADKNVTFHQLGGTASVLSINVNNRLYLEPFDVSIENTLSNWVSNHTEILNDLDVYVEQFNQSLYFTKLKNIEIILDINVGKLFYPGERVVEILEYWKGNEGFIVSSNSIVQFNTAISFEEECFSTGHIMSVNKSYWTLNNQEYNIIFLDPNIMTLSYQGPFWGTIDNSVQSAFFELAFGDDLKIGDPILAIIDGITVIGEVVAISGVTYQVLYNVNRVATVERTNAWYYDPSANNISVGSLTQSATYTEVVVGLTDIQYFNTASKLSVVGDDTIFLDSEDLRIISTIDTDETVIKQITNPINNLLYVLTDEFLYIIDPLTEEIKNTYPIVNGAFDIVCDTIRGDVYVSAKIWDMIIKYPSDLSAPLSTDYYSGYNYGKMVYSRDDDAIYVFTRQNENITTALNKAIYRIDLDNNVRDITFLISGSPADDIGIGDGYLGGGNTQSGTIHYNEFNGDLYIGNLNTLQIIDTSNEVLVDLGISTPTYYSVTLDSISKCFWMSKLDGYLTRINENAIISNIYIDTYGYLLYNDVDSNLYIASQDGSNKLYVYSTYLNQIFYIFDLDFELDKIVHNKYNDSISGINSTQSLMVDIHISFIYYQLKTFSNIFNTSSEVSASNFTAIDDSVQYGAYANDYEEYDFMYIKTRDFIRKPRKNYTTTGAPQVIWDVVWDKDDTEEIFMYDISGNHLSNIGSYAYTGEKPLINPTLKREPNDKLVLVGESYAQQTIFASFSYTLDYNDSITNISFIPEGIQTFFGFNSILEGVVGSKLKIVQREEININFPSYESYFTGEVTLPTQDITFYNNIESGFGEILLSGNSTDTFDSVIDLESFNTSNTNLKEGHVIKIKLTDNTSTSNKYVSGNDSMICRIYRIFQRKLVLIYLDGRKFTDGSTSIDDLYLTMNIDVQPKDIVNIDFYGQTEIEDIRFKTELTNTGRQINPEDVFIFKEYDINEGGMDWNYLNNKRKEMLMVRNDIYNYIGAYRSIINSINYFGYNDLELNEYFRNINEDSENYKKLSKVEIPDIFDNSVEGWTENYRKYHFPNTNYEDTNLFNLSYRFTDFDGNNQQTYSLEDAIIKLSGLKKWLEKNIIPITHKILDITGRSDVRDDHQIFHTPSAVTTYKMDDYITPIDFDINEVYALPIQSGSTVYNSVVDFKVGSTYSMVDYFTLNIKTYKIYPEWDVFTNYDYLDRVIYFGIIYENVLLDTTSTVTDSTAYKNTNNNPRENENLRNWSINVKYNEDDLVQHDRRFYKYSYQTENVNYLPWLTATGSCIFGTPSTTNEIYDNYYTDLVDRIGNEEDESNYWVSYGKDESNFDTLDIIKEQYPNDWCLFLERDEILTENIIISMINQPDEQYIGTKPVNNVAAQKMINALILGYNTVREQYKLKYKELTPAENIVLDNPDFILWDDITKWLEVDLDPVQTINEFRSGDDMLLPFNFTLDSAIDPYVVVSCNSNNGYGQIKNIKKSYEIKFDAEADSVLIKTQR